MSPDLITNADTHTRTFIGTLCTVEPLRSKVVLNIMDGLKGVWHAGPFSPLKKFRFYPGQIMFGTDPVAMDRLLIDIIDDERNGMAPFRSGSDRRSITARNSRNGPAIRT